MADEANPKAIEILRQWALTDAAGKKYLLTLHQPLTKDPALLARLPKPEYWQEVEPGSVPFVDKPVKERGKA